MSIEPGRELTHYRLIEKLGEGGMGVVWKALDTNLDREVAIKFLPEAFSDDRERLTRFEREAKLLASLNHPNIATIYGLHRDGKTSFLAMELIRGEDLARTMQRRPLQVTEALSVARQIAAALEATHERGVVHRDLKPANVYVTTGGEVKVLDFGIARSIDPTAMEHAETEATAAKTQPGTILGTVSYMSPEQARAKPVDARTDLWSFGCVLYEMLTHRPAFQGETRWDKLAAVLREDPDWDAVPDTTPDAVRELLRRCLTKDADQRLADAGEARRVVEAALETFTSPSGVPTIEEPSVDQPTPRRRIAPGLLVLALIAVASAIGFWAWRGGVSNVPGSSVAIDPHSVAVLPFESVGGGEDNAAFTAGIHDDILNQIAKIGDLKVISRTSVAEYRGTSKNLKQIAAELGVAAVLEGSVQRAGNQVRINVQLIDATSERNLWAERYNRELTTEGIFSIQSNIAEEIADALHATFSAEERRRIDQLPTADMQAYDAYLQALDYLNRPGYLHENLSASRLMFEQAISRDPSFALAWVGLSSVTADHYWMGGGTVEAPEAHLAKGIYHYVRREYQKALTELSMAEEGLPGHAELIRRKAYIMRRLGHWPAALRDLVRAQELDPRDAESMVEVGFTLLCMRRYDEAQPHFDRALALAPSYSVPDVYQALIPLWRDGTREAALSAASLVEVKPHDQWSYAHGWHAVLATRDFDRALAYLSGRQPISAQWYNYPPTLLRGWTYWLFDKDDAARPEFEAAAAELEAALRELPDDARLHGALGVAYAGLGRDDDAVREGRRAVVLLPIDKDVFVGAWQMQDLAWIHVMTGDLDAAVEALDHALSVPSAFSIEALLLDPRVDPLRDHADFEALVEKHRRRD